MKQAPDIAAVLHLDACGCVCDAGGCARRIDREASVRNDYRARGDRDAARPAVRENNVAGPMVICGTLFSVNWIWLAVITIALLLLVIEMPAEFTMTSRVTERELVSNRPIPVALT